MIRQYELVERVKATDPAADEDTINRAYVFSMKAHGTQKRASGDPYFSHPLEVAGILTELKLDGASIVTALLHDTIEDTLTTLDEIERLFGPTIAKLVDGVTKLSRLELQSDQTKQAENFRKLLLAMSEDIRVLLVKLADRLHNMRTLGYIADADKRRTVARETLEIYAPLAERIGMNAMKDELEDIAFEELYPEAQESIRARFEFLRQEGGDMVPRIVEALTTTLATSGLEVEVSGREKRPYSIWRKMQRKHVTFEQLADVIAFRAVVASEDDCYRALGVLHRAYRVVPGRFKDYVSTPKLNGYRSIHTAVVGPERQRVEVQIRTRKMHEEAELGVAAHWSFKQDANAGMREGRQYRWIRELLDILEHALGPEEFLEHTKLEMYRDQVFCFTPKGDLIALSQGATPVDFAYAVHSGVGDTCVGAKINGRMMPLRTELGNGDQIEIVRSTVAAPSPTWEGFVVTGKARTRIRRFVRSQEREQYLALGRGIAEKAFRTEGQDYSEKLVETALPKLKLKSLDELYVLLGRGDLTGKQLTEVVFPYRRLKDVVGNVLPLVRRRSRSVERGVPIKGLIPGMAVHYAECCHPLPGERIVGIVTTGKGVTVHTIDCDTLVDFQDDPERWLDLAWDAEMEADGELQGRLSLVISNEPGSLGAISTVIAENSGNISNLKITNRSADFFEMVIDVEVEDVRHLSNIVAALRAIPVISSVERARM